VVESLPSKYEVLNCQKKKKFKSAVYLTHTVGWGLLILVFHFYAWVDDKIQSSASVSEEWASPL
jgi:hypothetical protein